MSRLTKDLRFPLALWVLASAALIAWSLQYESMVFITALYVGLNGAAFLLTIHRDPPAHQTALRLMAWCTAAQLPTMIVIIVDTDRMRQRFEADDETGTDDQRSLGRHPFESET